MKRLHYVTFVFQCLYECSDERSKNGEGVRFVEEGRDWRLPGFLHVDDFTLCGKSEENLKVMEHFV